MTGQVYVFGYGSLLEPTSLHRTVPEVPLHSCLPATAEGYVRAFDVAFPNDGTQADKAYYAPDGTRPARVLLANLAPARSAANDGPTHAVRTHATHATHGVELDPIRAVGSGATGADETHATQAAHAVERNETYAVVTGATHGVEPLPHAAANGICIPVGPDELDALRGRERRYDEVDITEHIRPYRGRPAPDGTVLAFIGSAAFTRPADIERAVVSASYLDTIRSGAEYWERVVPGFERDYRASTIDPPPTAIASLNRVDAHGEST